MKISWIERISQNLGLIPRLERSGPPEPLREAGPLERYPSPDQWDDFVELDAQAWPKRVERHYSIVPTTCFNCEAACGLLAYIDKETNQVRKFEGNPYHPGSRGKELCQGSGFHQPDSGLSTDTLSSKAERSAGFRGVGKDQLGPGVIGNCGQDPKVAAGRSTGQGGLSRGTTRP